MKRMICAAALILSLCRLALPVSAMELDVAGKSAVLMDVATGTILYESNSHERLAPASVTKVMTMLLIMEAVDSGKIALTDMVTASEAAAAKGGSQIYLKAGETMSVSVKMGMALMFIGTLCFELIPSQMLSVFTGDQRVIDIGTVAFHYIGVSFIPMVTSLTFPVFFQAIGSAGKSSILTLVRTMVLFVPLGYLFSRIGLNYFWLTFPVTECLTTCLGVYFYRKFIKRTE